MIIVKRYECKSYSANTYSISQLESNSVWLIDAGCIKSILNDLLPNQGIAGIFLTHAHFDHIFEINELIHQFPDCRIYGSKSCLQNLRSSKANLSWYRNIPIELVRGETHTLHDKDSITLFKSVNLTALHTPGHTPGSFCYQVGEYLFTGDAYIPFHKTVTKLKGGNKTQSLQSLKKLCYSVTPNTIIAPGHGETYTAKQTDLFTCYN